MDNSSAQAVQQQIIICDNGQSKIKVGYAGENIPRHEIPTVVGKPKLQTTKDHHPSFPPTPARENSNMNIICGYEALDQRKTHDLTYPISTGQITDWDSMGYLYDDAFYNQLKLPSSSLDKNRIILSESPLTPTQHRNKIIETMFETYNFSHLNISLSPILTLYAQGLLTGIVIDSGEGSTTIVPVYESYVSPHLIKTIPVAGRAITNHLMKLLAFRGYNLDFETARYVKERSCYTAYDLERERTLVRETTSTLEKVVLPDGKVVRIERERFEAPECLFHPGVLGLEDAGLGKAVFSCVMEADIDCRLDYFKKIVLAGGSTMFPGLPNRLEKEIRRHYLDLVLKGDANRMKKLKIGIEDPPFRTHLVFLGASVLGNLMKEKDSFWMTKEYYEDVGAERAFSKCHI
mmetsp:Transcript_8173/g.10010  ORF Transcript_8173/g.10010 Transcript_8173/m.10010 type:complete len:405 (-) Transcript_8173:30-1244(-)|eukprot:CAMPEP_0172514246 /NCGR_PEP_ID=MMETSP1066-20121228/258527_1 /TAXON_ID=671091 /ORGANISM="Coscinodiscus wailesii, Strain CCMP2513" /LENGTH=404 /DNA_ID=CAMNT_0013294827 /DNA_START=33 /DNA_END=1247 /DNA_ORIENTATION=-